mmetsp:Transcript_121834/g.234995  ORF Transcript_121834/g.234995 Transcript_121834/m.234995 type:complete len:514 (+) Transcript_121834:65-1606(+)
MAADLERSMTGMVPEMAKPICHKPIPPVPKGLKLDEWGKPPVTLCLFYQYVEPPWSSMDHRRAINFVNELARKEAVTGRGRCSVEGLNCTLTGTAEGIRAFCQGLRDWNPLFKECDFKFTDGLPWNKRFKAFTLQKKEELVAYGLPPEKAPSLKDNRTTHVEAVEYHKMMAEKDSVIIDVRNFYESNIGHFQPPTGGAELLDPKMRNSHEFPKWLNMPETKEKLKGKKVMMYCTGGIRCERASALLSQIENQEEDFQTQGIVMVRGGIERYMRTFPEGGFWKGKNYLFDRRFEQVPEKKSADALEKDVESFCCVCRKPWGQYRGAYKCGEKLCQVPVIVCDDCQHAEVDKPALRCPLCVEGYSLREKDKCALKDAVYDVTSTGTKRKANPADEKAQKKRAKHEGKKPSKRIFVGNLPLVIDATAIKNVLGDAVKLIHWIPDRKTGLWYGSTFVEMVSKQEAKRVVQEASEGNGIRIGKRRLRVNFAPPGESDEWPPADHKELERPPIPVTVPK